MARQSPAAGRNETAPAPSADAPPDLPQPQVLRVQPDNDVITGQRAARSGRYDLAVASFERARTTPKLRAAADDAAFQALREVDISQFLVGQVYARLGRPVTQYRGFDAIDPPLNRAAVLSKLRALAEVDDPVRQPRRALLAADQIERGEVVDPSVFEASEHPALAVSLARRALARGDIATLERSLQLLDRGAVPLSAGQVLRARAMLAQGSTVTAARAFNLALLYLDSAADGERVRYERSYKGFQIIHFRNEFFAIPSDQCPVAVDRNGTAVAIVAHRIPAWARALVLRLFPIVLVDILRRVVTRLPLRRRLALDQLTRSSDLLVVLQSIDRAKRGTR
jgi:hypothetical protein